MRPQHPEPLGLVELQFATLELHGHYTLTRFPDGTEYGAYPQDSRLYRALAERLGYGGNLMLYCAEHEAMHSLIAEELWGAPSRVLWPLAHGGVGEKTDVLAEEALAILFQGFIRAGHVVPATAPGVDWFAMRERARPIVAEMDRAYGGPTQ